MNEGRSRRSRFGGIAAAFLGGLLFAGLLTCPTSPPLSSRRPIPAPRSPICLRARPGSPTWSEAFASVAST